MSNKVQTIGILRPCSVRGCRGEGLWKPVVQIPYRQRLDLKGVPVLDIRSWKLAEATLELHFCVEHKKNVDQNDLIAFATKAFWSENTPFRVEVDTPRIGMRWERSNPGVIVKDDAQTGLS